MHHLAFLSEKSSISLKSLNKMIAKNYPNQKFIPKVTFIAKDISEQDLVLVELSKKSDLVVLNRIKSITSNIIVVISNLGLLRNVLYDDVSSVLLSPFTQEECSAAFSKVMKNTRYTESRLKIIKHAPDNILKVQYINTGLTAKKKWRSPHKAENPLTGRQLELLLSISNGFLYKEIAGQFGISIGTVKQHLHQIYERLHVNNKVEAINKMNLQQSVMAF